MIQAACFWTAVALPLSYPILLWVNGVTARSSSVVLAVLGVHLLALLGGRGYRPDSIER